MTGADHDAAVLGDQREDMARRHDIVAPAIRVDGDGDGLGPVGSGDAGGNTLPRLDRDREGRLVLGLVLLGHRRKAEFVHALPGHGEAHKSATEFGHEVDHIRRSLLGRDDEIAFVFAVLIVDEDEHAALARVLDHLFDRGKPAQRGLRHI